MSALRFFDSKGSALNDSVAQKQYLRKYSHNKYDRYYSTASEADSDRRNSTVGGKLTYEYACGRKDSSRGDDRGERLIQCFGNCFLYWHLLFKLHVAAGDNNSVVDIRSHLNGVYYKIAQEEQVCGFQIWKREVYPDTSLNYRDEQNGKSRRLERKQKNYYYEQGGQNTDDKVIVHKGSGQVVVAGGVAHNVNIFGVILCRDIVYGTQKIEGLPAFLGQVYVHEHTAVIVAPELQHRIGKGVVKLREGVHKLVVKGNVTLLHLVVGKHEHIYKGHSVSVQAVHHLAVVFFADSIGGIKYFCHLEVQIGKLGKLPRGQLVGKHVTVHGFDVGKARYRFHLGTFFKLGNKLSLVFVASGRNYQSHKI